MTHATIASLLLMLGGPAPNDDALKAALAREVVSPRTALAEVQDFCEARVPRMPEVRSADEWRRLAAKYRADTLDKVVFRGKAAEWRALPTRAEFQETIPGGPGYCIKKLRIEVVPGLWIPALLYEPDRLDGKVPVVLNVNGHDSKGKAADYKQIRCINQAKRGMLALNLEWFGMGQLATDGFRHGLINAVDLTGTSGITLHFLAMKRGLDVLLSQEHADPTRVAVTGLSGGGWQTSFFSPLDDRVTMMVPVAGYSSFRTRVRHFSDLGDSEQTPCDLATVVDYTHLTAMMAPHPTLLTFNAKDDCCFAAPHALPPLIEAAAPIYRLFDVPGNLRAHINEDPGNHNYGLDNRQAFYQMTADHWSTLAQVYGPREIPPDSEVKTPEQLKVELPSDNLDFRRLAESLGRDLPGLARAADADVTARRHRLRRLVVPYLSEVQAEAVAPESKKGFEVAYLKLRLGSTWTMPAVELTPTGGPEKTKDSAVLLLADKGRKEATSAARSQLDAGRRVLALDPFYVGELRPAERDYLWALMVAAVGERPLGLQAGEVISAARWWKAKLGYAPGVVAEGPRSCVIALVAAALDPDAIGGVELRGPMKSLKTLLEQGTDYTKAPELFCFGLLQSFDLAQIEELVAPRPVRRSGDAEGAPGD